MNLIYTKNNRQPTRRCGEIYYNNNNAIRYKNLLLLRLLLSMMVRIKSERHYQQHVHFYEHSNNVNIDGKY